MWKFLVFHLFAAAIPYTALDLNSNQQTTLPIGQKPAVVIFLSSTCPCSKSHEPVLADLKKEFTQFEFIGVLSGNQETLEKNQEHFKNFSFPIVRDNMNTLANAWGALKTPHAFIFDKEGKILYQGGVTDSRNAKKSQKNFLRIALQDISKGRPVSTEQQRTLGCYISR